MGERLNLFFAQSIPRPSVPEFTVQYLSGTVEVRIRNQPFVPTEVSGSNTSLYYNIRVKENSATNWIELYNPNDGFLSQDELSEYTEISYSSSRWGYETVSFSYGAQVDFQVEAMNGHVHRIIQGNMAPWYFTGETSDWSITQTITIGASQTSSPEPTIPPSSNPLPSEEPQSTEQELILGVAVTIVVFCAGLGLLVCLIIRK